MRGAAHDQPDDGLDSLTSAIVIVAVVAIMLVAALVLGQRDRAIAAGEQTAVAVATASAAATPSASETETAAPSAGPGEYVVRRGDSLFSVAAELGLSPNELIFWNADEYPTLHSTPALRAGWVLRTTGPALPTATPRPTPAPTPTPVLAAPSMPGMPSFTSASFPATERVTVSWYAVTGASRAEILASILANGPYSEWVGGTATAHVRVQPSFDFYFQTGPVGYCDVVASGDPAVSITYEVLLPAWSPPGGVPVEVGTLDWWAVELGETVAHEAHHITLYEEHLLAMRELVEEGSCASVSDGLGVIWDGALQANCEFDLAEYGYAAGLTLESCLLTDG
jgi:predicted secreted Zn-dependent protease